MNKKCPICKKMRLIKYFRKYKGGRNMGLRHSYCKICETAYKRKWAKGKPWLKAYEHIISRCRYDKKHPYYKKVTAAITTKEVKSLWFRDKAYLMKRPSIDRKDNDNHYIFSNCRFIEFLENVRRRETRNRHTGPKEWHLKPFVAPHNP